MNAPTTDRLESKWPHFSQLVSLALAVLTVLVTLALACIYYGTEKWLTLGFKILELSVQTVLITILGGVLVQAYIKWHSRASLINEFRKATAEAVIREYSAAKRARRLLRANCFQGPAGNTVDPWTDVPLSAYDTQISSINDAQLALELVKRRLKLLGTAFESANGLSQKANDMETYLGNIVAEYERHRNRELKRDPIPLNELPRLRAFIARHKRGNSLSDFATFSGPFDDLLKLLEREGVWVAI